MKTGLIFATVGVILTFGAWQSRVLDRVVVVVIGSCAALAIGSGWGARFLGVRLRRWGRRPYRVPVWLNWVANLFVTTVLVLAAFALVFGIVAVTLMILGV